MADLAMMPRASPSLVGGIWVPISAGFVGVGLDL